MVVIHYGDWDWTAFCGVEFHTVNCEHCAVKLGEVLASNRFCGNWVSLDNTRGMSFSGVKLGVGVWDISIAV